MSSPLTSRSISRTRTTSRVIFALDFATVAEAREAAREVAPAVGMLKIGLELFVAAGPAAIAIGREREVGRPIFLDLKLHDIPETVARAVARAASLGAVLLTVHASGGRAMLRAAVDAARGTDLAVCGVTILTSFDDADLGDVGVAGTLDDAVLRLAKMAWDEGVRAFVCSPREVKALRAAFPEATLVTPGVRPAGGAAGDQKRVATPEQAIRDGASFVVVGRPIRDAADRLAAARAIAEGVEGASATPEVAR